MNPRNPGSGRPSVRFSTVAAVALAAAAACVFQFYGNSTRGYVDTASLFRWWEYQWFNADSETQHGPIILALSIALLVRNLRAERVRGGSRTGDGATPYAAAMVGGLALHALGFTAQQTRVSILGLLLFSWGFAGFGWGSRAARAAAFPIAFLLFAIPVNALDGTGFWLRVWVVDSTAAISHGLGIRVIRNGTQLLAPDGRYDYDVAAACSGVRSLVALAALSLLIAYLRFRPAWLRVAFLLLCFPLVYIGNVLRVVSIVVAAQAGGTRWGNLAHEAMGYGVFAIVLGGVTLAAEWVSSRRPEWCAGRGPDVSGEGRAEMDGSAGARSDPEDASAPPGMPVPTPIPWLAGAAVLGSIAAVALLLARVAGRPDVGIAGVKLSADGLNPVELPAFVGSEWIGRFAEVSAVERQVLPPDTGYSRRIYVPLSDPGHPVFLSIVLSGRDRTSIHRPELCLVGQGWTVVDSFRHRFRHPAGGDFPAEVLRVRREVSSGGRRTVVPQLVAYWFVGDDRVVAGHVERLALDAWYRVARGRADRWAYVLAQTGSSGGEGAALARIQALLDGTLGVFQGTERLEVAGVRSTVGGP